MSIMHEIFVLCEDTSIIDTTSEDMMMSSCNDLDLL